MNTLRRHLRDSFATRYSFHGHDKCFFRQCTVPSTLRCFRECCIQLLMRSSCSNFLLAELRGFARMYLHVHIKWGSNPTRIQLGTVGTIARTYCNNKDMCSFPKHNHSLNLTINKRSKLYQHRCGNCGGSRRFRRLCAHGEQDVT